LLQECYNILTTSRWAAKLNWLENAYSRPLSRYSDVAGLWYAIRVH